MKRLWVLNLVAAVVLLAGVCGCQRIRSVLRPPKKAEPAPKPQVCGKNGLSADCVVTYFGDEGRPYYSQQRHIIWPDSERIVVSARQPQGDFQCELSAGQFRVQNSPGALAASTMRFCDKPLLQVILTCFLANAGFGAAPSGSGVEPVKIEGQWYQPVDWPSRQKGARPVAYRNIDTGIIDRVRVDDSETGQYLLATGYNRRQVEAAGRLIPTKIDVFTADKAHSSLNRILQLSYQNWK